MNIPSTAINIAEIGPVAAAVIDFYNALSTTASQELKHIRTCSQVEETANTYYLNRTELTVTLLETN